MLSQRRPKMFPAIAIRGAVLLAFTALFFAFLCATPAVAQAKEYEIDSVDISAWVQEDGTLDVWE
ncbi:MAG: hypothetical protein J5804_05630, partial [Eggerthellaceae bacterium]|nr:hypothetical protein [Eggerthellaceae bacterium]